MGFIAQLWIPILATAAACWFWSFLSWAVLPIHRGDFRGLPDEDGFLNALRALNVPPGNYGFPHCESHSQSKDPAFQEKWKSGPAGMLNIWPKINMGRNMVLTFLVYLVVSTLIAYLGSAAGLTGADRAHAFQIAGTAGVLAYTFAFIPNGIWFNHGRAIFTNMLDGVVLGLLTGTIFAWLWPAA